MGQKINPNIFRLGQVKEWKSKYIEKKPSESSTVIFRDLEIKKFIYRFFTKKNLKVQNCRVNYSESSLYIFISYYNSFSFFSTDQKIKTEYEYKNSYSTLFNDQNLNIKKATTKKHIYAPKAYKKNFSTLVRINLFKNYYLLHKKSQRLKLINNLKSHFDTINCKTLKHKVT